MTLPRMTQAAPLIPPLSAATASIVDQAVAIDQLTHRYPGSPADRPALDGVTLTIRPGEIFGVLGPNGGGKSTLFRILATMQKPTSGSVRVFGADPVIASHRVRGMLGVVFQYPSLDLKLTARENLLHHGRLYGLGGKELSNRIDAALDAANLTDRAGEYVERFSGGMRRKVEIAKAMLHAPRLLLLDEPSTGLDPGARRDVWRQIETLRSVHGVTVAMTTHLMDEADRCDRLAILSAGRMVIQGTPSELKSMIGGDVVSLEAEPPGDMEGVEALCRQIAEQFGPWQHGKPPAVIDGRIRIERQDGAAFVATLAGAFPGRVRSITVGRPTLDDVFMHMTGRAIGDEAQPTAGEPPAVRRPRQR